MAMALRSDVIEKCAKSGECRPIDLVYLSSQTLGDASLEAEILSMFASQLPIYTNCLVDGGDSASIKEAGHTLKGAARSVGAFRLSEIAASAEISGAVDKDALLSEVKSVIAYIDRLA